MTGERALGNKKAPGYHPMRARQILAQPHGFIWVPTALLPQHGVRWEEIDEPSRARAVITCGTLDEFRNFDGFTLTTRVEAGYHFGAEAYFPFFRVMRLGEVRFQSP
ncbi:hypothetical protein [Halomonas sp. BC04]|uniref:hypothetical protein n=1 Tax=Halomonas sp. BC04 TaxID=1403540 RepID=UPI0003ED8AE7|nr:hypothetical protein [Halomonas sp. BC04]EWG99116.1 hypothetical protein Q427_26790 [Halomonas sp. BC04]